MLAVGWWLIPITLYHIVSLYFDAASWRQLFPTSNRPSQSNFVWMRWIRESVSSLLPVAGVGGDVVGARLAHQRGVPGAQATAESRPLVVLGGGKSGGGQGTGIQVNAYLWRATLDTLSFMPLVSADPFGGVIITDWYSPPATPDERFKANAYILSQQMTANAIQVSLFH